MFSIDDVLNATRTLPPPERRTLTRHPSPQPAATLVPVVDVGGEAAIVVTKRPTTMTFHRDEWVFPGGRLDPQHDRTGADAARREAAEELGIDPSAIDVVGQLTTHGPISTGYVVEVFVGVIEPPLRLRPNPAEVAEALVLPMSHFLTPGHCFVGPIDAIYDPGPIEATPASDWSTTEVRYFVVRDREHLWGLQGDILHELLTHVASSVGARR